MYMFLLCLQIVLFREEWESSFLPDLEPHFIMKCHSAEPRNNLMLTLYLFLWQCQKFSLNILKYDSVLAAVAVEVIVFSHVSPNLFCHPTRSNVS